VTRVCFHHQEEAREGELEDRVVDGRGTAEMMVWRLTVNLRRHVEGGEKNIGLVCKRAL